MRRPTSDREYADSAALEFWMADLFAAVAAGNSVPLTKDGQVLAVSPEVAEAGRRALGR